MIRVVAGTTIFSDVVGLRVSIIYSEVDEVTGKVLADNKRIDRVIVDPVMKENATNLIANAQAMIESLE